MMSLISGIVERPDHVPVEVARARDVHRRGADGRPVVGGRMVGEQRVLPGTVVLHLHEGGAAVAVDEVDELLHARGCTCRRPCGSDDASGTPGDSPRWAPRPR